MKYEIYNCDCLNLSLDKQVDFVYSDPPYASSDEDVYYGIGDNLDAYIKYMEDRLVRIKSFMKKDSNIIIHIDYKAVHYLKVRMDQIFGRENFRNEVIWGFSNPTRTKRWLPRKHQNLLWYGMGDYIYNECRVPYKTKMNVGGKTAWSKEKIPWEKYRDKGKILEDWWTDIPAICRNEPEKIGYATQKPLQLMKRVLSLWSNAGSVVLDPFMGSGSFIEAAIGMGRYAIGSDISDKSYTLVSNRIANMQQDIFSE